MTEFQLSFQILKDDAVKVLQSVCQQIWKIQQHHRTGKDQFSFQSQRAMPKNVQTIVQLCLFDILARLCSKSIKRGFSSMWTKNFPMYKLSFKEAEEPEIKLPTFIGSWRKQGSSRKTSTASLTKAFDCVHNKLWNNFKEMEVPYLLTCLLRNLYVG